MSQLSSCTDARFQERNDFTLLKPDTRKGEVSRSEEQRLPAYKSQVREPWSTDTAKGRHAPHNWNHPSRSGLGAPGCQHPSDPRGFGA